MLRVRQTRRRHEVWSTWWQVKAYRVHPVMRNGYIHAFVTAKLEEASGRTGLPCLADAHVLIASLITNFLEDCGKSTFSPHFLARRGAPWRTWKVNSMPFGKGGTAAARKWQYGHSVGQDGLAPENGLVLPTAVLLWPGRNWGKLVHITATVAELDWSAVSASLDTDICYALGKGDGRYGDKSAYHALVVHSHCRPMSAQGTPCEHIGSLMRKVWDSMTANQHFNAATFMDTVTLREADLACIGSERDKFVCDFVAECLRFTATGYTRKPYISERQERARKRDGLAPNTSRPISRIRHAQKGKMAEAFDNSGARDDSADDEEGPLSLGQARQKPLDYVASSGASA